MPGRDPSLGESNCIHSHRFRNGTPFADPPWMPYLTSTHSIFTHTMFYLLYVLLTTGDFGTYSTFTYLYDLELSYGILLY